MFTGLSHLEAHFLSVQAVLSRASRKASFRRIYRARTYRGMVLVVVVVVVLMAPVVVCTVRRLNEREYKIPIANHTSTTDILVHSVVVVVLVAIFAAFGGGVLLWEVAVVCAATVVVPLMRASKKMVQPSLGTRAAEYL